MPIFATDETGGEQELYDGEDYDLWETDQVYQDLALEADDIPGDDAPESDE